MRRWLNPETVRYPVACAAGLLLALAFPLPGLAGLAWVAPAMLWIGAVGLRGAEGFRYGYVGGLVHFLVLLRWMRHMPFPPGAYAAWFALSGYCALYPAAWVWIGLRMLGPVRRPSPTAGNEDVPAPGPAGGVAFARWHTAALDLVGRPWSSRAGLLFGLAAAWVALEFARSRLLTGFPWALLGVSQWHQLPLIQPASVAGVFGVSFLVAWCGLALGGALLAMALRPESRGSWTAEARLPVVATLMVMGWGLREVMAYRTAERRAAGRITLGLVQPSVPQTLLWDPAEQDRTFAKTLDLSGRALALKPDVLVWPEGSFGLSSTNIGRVIGRLDGAGWVFCADDADGSGPDERRYNAAFHWTGADRPVVSYRKRRLVIFGEYVPLARWLPFLRRLTPIGDGFAAGDRPATFRLGPGAVAAPVICFEDVFPHGVRDHVAADVDLVLGLTNDGWFSESAAQWQHTANAVFRAVENGVPVVRVANNGITGWWDARGTPRDILGERDGAPYAPGVLLAEIPTGVPREPTPYRRHGDVFAWACIVVTAWSAVRPRR